MIQKKKLRLSRHQQILLAPVGACCYNIQKLQLTVPPLCIEDLGYKVSNSNLTRTYL
jgi:hypothetical protein